jgi:hypothetical protein
MIKGMDPWTDRFFIQPRWHRTAKYPDFATLTQTLAGHY